MAKRDVNGTQFVQFGDILAEVHLPEQKVRTYLAILEHNHDPDAVVRRFQPDKRETWYPVNIIEKIRALVDNGQ